MALPSKQHQVKLVKRAPYPGSFREGEHLVSFWDQPIQHEKGHCLVKNLVMSLDPTLRPQMSIDTYVKKVELESVMRATTLGEVVVAAGDFKVGDLVLSTMGEGGFQEYYSAQPRSLQKVILPDDIPITAALGIMGLTGLTAYFGLLRVGQPRKGETVLVSGAAGATGSVVAQIAKHIVGCRVIGIAGGPAKCKFLVDELGLDGAIDYKDAKLDFNKAIKNTCPKGVDVYFDNVGGWMLNACLRRMKYKGRVVCCGAISQYNSSKEPEGIPAAYVASLVSKSIRMEGFLVMNYISEFSKATTDLAKWLKEGKLRNQETIVEGLENAAAGFRGMFEGKNKGKLLVRIA